MEPSGTPIYYKCDDGIFRPLVDVRQLPSTSSGVYDTVLWNGSNTVLQQRPSSVGPNGSKRNTKSRNFEASKSATKQAENTVNTERLTSSSGGNKSMYSNLVVNQIKKGQLHNAAQPEKTIKTLEIPAARRIAAKIENKNNSFEKMHIEEGNIHQGPSKSSGIKIPKDSFVKANNLKVCQRKKEQTESRVDTGELPFRRPRLCPPLTMIMPKQQTKAVNKEILQDDKEQVLNIADIEESQSDNSVIHTPITLNVQKSLSPSRSPRLCPSLTMIMPKPQTKIFNRSVLQGEQEQVGNVGIIEESPFENSVISETIASNKPKKKGKKASIDISKGPSGNMVSTEESHLKDGVKNILNRINKETKSSMNSCRDKKKIENIQQTPSTTIEITKPMELKIPVHQTTLNHFARSMGENEAAGIHQRASSSSEMCGPMMQESFSLLDVANDSASFNGEAVQGSSESSGMNSSAVKKNDVEHITRSPRVRRTPLWNLPNSLILPDLSSLKKVQELADEKTCNGIIDDIERIDDSEPDCSEKDLLHGLEYGKIKTLYTHIMGANSLPGTLREIGLLTIRTMLCSIDRRLLINLIGKEKFVNFNRVVFWGFNRKRPVNFLFSTVKPDNYRIDDAKIELLKCVKGLNSRNKEKVVGIECQACRKIMDSFVSFVDHLNRTTSEITYMCLHCGYLRFTNMCALVYHVLTDNYMKPSLEYCLVCGLFCESLEHHLLDPENILNNRKVQCKLCEFTAFSICSLKFHLSCHTEELPHICAECGVYFSFKDHLEEHMKNVCFMNHKFKYYLCTSESCGMIFSYLENFYTHISTEHYERRVICSICQEILSAQREFLAHRSTEHPGEMCSFNVYNHCSLCPDSTFRGMSQQKHLSKHGCENECSTIVYKCQCDFQTRFKTKFIEHKNAADCSQETFHRPQVMKVCQNCLDVKSFNYMTSQFVCEECQVALQPSLSLMNYFCELCNLVIDYSWKSVLDHFFLFHKRVDMLSVSIHTMLIVSKKKVVSGRYISQKSITEVDVEFINTFVKELLGSTTKIVLDTETKSDSSSDVELAKGAGRITIRSPSSINASLSNTKDIPLPSPPVLDNSGVDEKNKQQIPHKNFENTKLNSLRSDNISVPSNKRSKNVRKDIFLCRKCNFTSCYQSEMSRHSENHYPAEYKCPECDDSFKTSSARNNHLRKNHGLIPLG